MLHSTKQPNLRAPSSLPSLPSIPQHPPATHSNPQHPAAGAAWSPWGNGIDMTDIRSARHPKVFLGEAALDATVEFIFKGLVAGSLLRAYPQTDLAAVKEELKKFLSDSFGGVFPGIRIGRDLLTEQAIQGFEEVLVAVIEDHQLEGPTALVKAAGDHWK
eukprot:Skav227925  [mRNA]  locus=scaffold146:203109:204940:+ [translate_table: standard]